MKKKLVLNRETIRSLTEEEAKKVIAECFCWSSHTDCKLGSCGICGG